MMDFININLMVMMLEDWMEVSYISHTFMKTSKTNENNTEYSKFRRRHCKPSQ